MTVNYFIKCPICGSITRMRSPAGYVYSTPVHIHCGKCNTLLTGNFISDNKNIKAYYTALNCIQVDQQNYDYYGEASGEMLCRKIVYIPNDKDIMLPPSPSPVFGLMWSMNQEDVSDYINFANHLSDISNNWNTIRIKYDLFLNNKYELIRDKFSDEALKYGYAMSDDNSIIRYVYFSCFKDCGGIFKRKEITKLLQDVNYHFNHLEITSLNTYFVELDKEKRLETIQSKLFKTIFSFFEIAPNMMPAIAATHYDDQSKIDKQLLGISTCTFDDLKQFYQDAFETLADCCDIVIALDNIESRLSYNIFENNFDMAKFREQRKGNKIKYLNKNEFYAKAFNLNSDSNELRNAIGHNDYKYDGISQEIKYTPNASNGIEKQVFLIDVAIECVQLLRSTYILAFLVYELIRYKKCNVSESMEMHSLFYKKIKSQNRCPCGSQKKYRDCCKKQIDLKKRNNENYYPNVADMCL